MVFVLLLMAIVACASVLGVSFHKMHTHIQDAEQSYASYQEHADNWEFAEAAADLRVVAAELDALGDETHEWYWTYARAVPILGVDVACAQQLTEVADSLANEALLPVVACVESLLGDGTATDVGGIISQKAGQVGDLVAAIADAREVVATCRSSMEKVPTSHFDRLNALAGEVREAVTGADDIFNGLDGLFALGLAGILGSQ